MRGTTGFHDQLIKPDRIEQPLTPSNLGSPSSKAVYLTYWPVFCRRMGATPTLTIPVEKAGYRVFPTKMLPT
jgi:hypothetical protein